MYILHIYVKKKKGGGIKYSCVQLRELCFVLVRAAVGLMY